MMKKLYIALLITVFTTGFLNFGSLIYASSGSASEVCSGISEINSTGCDKNATGSSINSTLSFVLNFITALAGIIAVFSVIIGGLRYITSGGSAEKTNQAKDTILFAIVGLVIVALAQVIVHFVLGKAFKL